MSQLPKPPLRQFSFALLMAVLLLASGCSSFIARRMAQAPNTYPTWFAPEPRVTLGFNNRFLRDIPRQKIAVGLPAATLSYRVVDPRDYQMTVTEKSEAEHGHTNYTFSFNAKFPAATNHWITSPRGTVFLLHGYGLAQFSMVPWAIKLAGEGWRCVLVDLRGHGKSTGSKIYYGLVETGDLSQLLDKLEAQHQVAGPVSVMGESYGGALSIRWKSVEPRVSNVIALAPFNNLSNAVLNITREYACWIPKSLLRAGMVRLPEMYHVTADDLNTSSVLERSPVKCLIIAGGADDVIPPAEERHLSTLAAPGSRFIVVPGATHEAVPYFFDELAPAVLDWLAKSSTQTGDLSNPCYAPLAQIQHGH